MKYCNRCGAQLSTAQEAAETSALKERLDEYLTGLFWVTVIGLGLIIGGLALMKQLHFGDGLIIGYMILSSTAFLINFGLNLWEIVRMIRGSKAAKALRQAEQFDTNALEPAKPRIALESAPSVTENTTRRLEREQIT